MPTTIPATNIGTPDNGCAVVSLLSENAQQQIGALLAKLTDDLPGVIWPMPPTSLHTTLCEIIQPKPYSEDKALIYERDKDKYMQALEEVFAGVGPIKVEFNVIEVSPQAIIVRGDDGGVFNDIRAEIVKKLPFPAETKQPPDIVHSSIARYLKEVDLKTVEEAASHYAISFEETITECQLMYPIWPHLLRYEVVRRYSLAHAQ